MSSIRVRVSRLLPKAYGLLGSSVSLFPHLENWSLNIYMFAYLVFHSLTMPTANVLLTIRDYARRLTTQIWSLQIPAVKESPSSEGEKDENK